MLDLKLPSSIDSQTLADPPFADFVATHQENLPAHPLRRSRR
jgi:hypothetical protein